MGMIRIWNPMRRTGTTGQPREIYTRRGGELRMARHHKHHHGHRRHSNPFGIDRQVMTAVAYGVAGAVLVPTLNAKLLPSMNAGATGYLAKAALSFALKFAGDMLSKNAGDGLFVGGLIATGMAIVKDTLGAQLGLSAYWPSAFPIPTVSNPWGMTAGNPYAAFNPAPIASAAGTSMRGLTRAGRGGRAY